MGGGFREVTGVAGDSASAAFRYAYSAAEGGSFGVVG